MACKGASGVKKKLGFFNIIYLRGQDELWAKKIKIKWVKRIGERERGGGGGERESERETDSRQTNTDID